MDHCCLFFYTGHWKDTKGYNLNWPTGLAILILWCHSWQGYFSLMLVPQNWPLSVLWGYSFQGLGQGKVQLPWTSILSPVKTMTFFTVRSSRVVVTGSGFGKMSHKRKASSRQFVLLPYNINLNPRGEERCQNPQKVFRFLCWYSPFIAPI